MKGMTVVVTGATSGIGEVAADRLAGKGARILFIARDVHRGDETLKHLRAIAPHAEHAVYFADLSKVRDMRRVAAEIAAAEPKIDVLVNNAGALFNTRRVTEDGLEMTFATNHMSYFVLTNLLKPRMGPGARIVNTSSDAHSGPRLDFEDLQQAKHYRGFAAYGRSKLCNILFTRELARRLSGTGITANSLHPGFVATRFGDRSGGAISVAIRLAKNFALTPEQGAETIVYLASSPEVESTTGLYFHKSRPATPSKAAQNDDDAKRLWDISERLSGLDA